MLKKYAVKRDFIVEKLEALLHLVWPYASGMEY